jgi:hypothetical protein
MAASRPLRVVPAGEAAVDLHHVDGQVAQVGQGGVAGAEVVQRHPHTQGAQPASAREVSAGRAMTAVSVSSTTSRSGSSPVRAQVVPHPLDDALVRDRLRADVDRDGQGPPWAGH